MLPVTLAHQDFAPQVIPYASATAAIVALLAIVFAAVAVRAASARRNGALIWVALAFFVFALKQVFTSIVVVTDYVPHDIIELVLTVSDLLIMLFLFAPFLRRRRA